MRTAKWHGELTRFIDIKTTFILEGNIFDLQAYPSTDQEGQTRWDMVTLDNYLYKFLIDAGYKRIIFYNHIDGFFNDFNHEMIEEFAKNSKCGSIDKSTWRCMIDYSRAAEVIRESMQTKEDPIAFVMLLASRYVISPDNISDKERDFYTELLCASLKKNQARTENGMKNNTLFMVCNRANDVPAWFYLDNPLVKTLTINEPDKDVRKMFIDSQLTYFVDIDSASDKEIATFKEQFVDLTDGFKNLEMNALKILFKKEKYGISQIKDAINMFKYGLKDNPWHEIPIDRLDNAERIISQRVKGQDHAVTQVLDVVKRAASDMAGLQHSSGTKPKGILFFAGPTGTGKTELAKTVSELLFGDENACIRFDMSEFQQSHSDQKLLGAPPGYVGYESGGQLTNAIKEKPFSILLFDEIEKAHSSIFDKFLQILEDGRMTDGKGETVFFSECIIIFTSNLGIYTNDEFGNRKLNVTLDMPYEEMKEKVVNAIKDYFKIQLGRPEILNRIGDNFVVFDFIREPIAKQILDSQLNKIIKNISNSKGIDVSISDNAKSFLIKKSFGNLENGGRGIGNIVEKFFINPVARFIFDNKVESGKTINITSIDEESGVSTIKCEVV